MNVNIKNIWKFKIKNQRCFDYIYSKITPGGNRNQSNVIFQRNMYSRGILSFHFDTITF